MARPSPAIAVPPPPPPPAYGLNAAEVIECEGGQFDGWDDAFNLRSYGFTPFPASLKRTTDPVACEALWLTAYDDGYSSGTNDKCSIVSDYIEVASPEELEFCRLEPPPPPPPQKPTPTPTPAPIQDTYWIYWDEVAFYVISSNLSCSAPALPISCQDSELGWTLSCRESLGDVFCTHSNDGSFSCRQYLGDEVLCDGSKTCRIILSLFCSNSRDGTDIRCQWIGDVLFCYPSVGKDFSCQVSFGSWRCH